MGSKGKMVRFINFKMKCILQDGRVMVGTMLAFDKHMNLVLGDCVEVRKKGEKNEKRILGLVLLRGESIVSLSADGPPPVQKNRFRNPPQVSGGPGVGRTAGRGLAPNTSQFSNQGLKGNVRGVGGFQQSAVSYGGPPPMGMGRGMPPPPMGMMGRGMPMMPPRGMMPPPPQGMGGQMPPPPMMGRGMNNNNMNGNNMNFPPQGP